MRARRIKTGFHRLGVVLAAVCSAWAAVVVGYWLFEGMRDAVLIQFAMLVAAGGAVGYAVAYAIGWIIAGFVGDEISN